MKKTLHEKHCECLKEYAMKIISYKKRKWYCYRLKRRNHIFIKQSAINIPQKEFGDDNGIIQCKVRDHCHYKGKYRGVAHSICYLKQLLRDIVIAFHNESSCDYHVVIKV